MENTLPLALFLFLGVLVAPATRNRRRRERIPGLPDTSIHRFNFIGGIISGIIQQFIILVVALTAMAIILFVVGSYLSMSDWWLYAIYNQIMNAAMAVFALVLYWVVWFISLFYNPLVELIFGILVNPILKLVRITPIDVTALHIDPTTFTEQFVEVLKELFNIEGASA